MKNCVVNVPTAPFPISGKFPKKPNNKNNMKIIYEVGDMLTTPNQFLVQGCNAQGAMGSGIAKSIRDIYPNVYTEYHQVYLNHGLDLGDVIPVAVPAVEYRGTHYSERIILNAITQEYAGREDVRYVSYDGIARSIERINDLVKAASIDCMLMSVKPEVSFPLIGAGLARGDWFVIARLIETLSVNFQPRVYVQTQDELNAIMLLLQNS
jgi:O-acetyl-ADP-ribose deacetylase (regulator of RNase III)